MTNQALDHASLFALNAFKAAEEALLQLKHMADNNQDSILVPLRNIPVTVANENDWEFVAIQDEHGHHIAVF